ncbi:MAG: porin [Sphingobium sp.]
MTISFRSLYRVVLLGGCAGLSTIAHAQQGITAEDVAALRAEIAALRAQVQTLQQRADQADADKSAQMAAAPGSSAPAAMAQQATNGSASSTTAPTPATVPPPVSVAWKSAPQLKQGDWSFKPKGRMQFDTVIVNAPGSVDDNGLGTSTEVRRLRLGGEGSLPGNFGYKLEAEFSDNKVDLVDAYISWQSGNFGVRLGNQNQFQSLDELIGDTTGTVMERAAFTDAFNFERRLGIALEWQKGPFLVQGGFFGDDVNALSAGNGDENNSYGVDGRVVFAPRLGEAQLHFGASGHWRDLNSTADAGVRYRQRPFSHATDSRMIDTGAFGARSETHYGLEFAAVRGRWHTAAETHWMTADRIGGADPRFFGGYAEVGYFLTSGDTRTYKNGIFDRSAPKNPVDQGGIGSIQLTFRYDYLDLDDRDIRGGKQNGYIGGLVWSPINYLRFNLNYAHLDYRDAAIYAGTTRDFGVDVVGLRAEFDY